MPSEFQGQVIIITGAGSGIGRATAIQLAKEGANLALCDLNPDSLDNLIAELSNNSNNHRAYTLDVGDPTAVNTTISSIATHFTKIDHLFNCAGVNPTYYTLTSTTDSYWDKLVNTNLRGPYNLTRAVIPHLHSGSSIVNVSSNAGIRASAGYAIYNATKFGVIGFSKSMALELGSQGIRVNAVAPGPINTPTNRSVLEGESSVRETEKGIAMGRLGTPEEVAEVVVFLMSEKAKYVNGSVVEINGGTL